jgi:MYXO-CTERM domain-containing protein
VLGGDVVGQTHGFVLTRMHYRYGRDGLDEDLVFRAAPPIVGGRGMPDQEGNMQEEGAQPGSINNYQGRYVILHPWEGAVACESPVRGRWGGPPGGGGPTPPRPPLAAENQAMRGGATSAEPAIRSVGQAVEVSIPAIFVQAGVAEAALPTDPGPAGGPPVPGEPGEPAAVPDTHAGPAGPGAGPPASAAEGGCASCNTTGAPAGFAGLLAVLAVALLRRRT